MIRHLRILAVDDDAVILEVLATYFSDRGYYVQTRLNGREALDALREEEFDLVISDIDMAGMNGFEFLRLARRNHPSLGIILMTAFEDRFPVSEALSAGADGYITKPFSLKKLSLIFDSAYWAAISREDWWLAHSEGSDDQL